MTFRLVKVLSPGLLAISRDNHISLWNQAKLRRVRHCAFCNKLLVPGDQAFSPLGNAMYRYERLCILCADKMKEGV